jgi:hypothetical protein
LNIIFIIKIKYNIWRNFNTPKCNGVFPCWLAISTFALDKSNNLTIRGSSIWCNGVEPYWLMALISALDLINIDATLSLRT